MADTKITALAAIGANPINVATFPIPMVDLLDNSMAASGTTKKVTVNQILGAGGTATLASATITGDLTVDTSTLKVDTTNDRVGLGIAAPAYRLHVQGAASLQLVLQSNDTNANAKEGTVNVRHYTNAEEPVSAVGGFTTSTANEVYLGGGFNGGNAATLLGFYTAANNTTTIGTERYRIASDGVATWSNVGGGSGTAMTLNSTGLGVGEAASVSRLQARGSTTDSSAYILYGKASSGNVICFMRNDGRFLVGNGTSDNFIVTETGNVGIGVTPSAKLDVAGNARVQLAFFTGGTIPGLTNENPFAYRVPGGGLGLGAATETATTSPIIFYTGQGGVERVRVKGAGQLRFFPLAVDPAGAEAGDVYYNSSSNKLKCYNGSTWNDLF
jgi:hypothetical protein